MQRSAVVLLECSREAKDLEKLDVEMQERWLELKPVCYPAHSAAQTLIVEIVATVIFVIIYSFSDSISVRK